LVQTDEERKAKKKEYDSKPERKEYEKRNVLFHRTFLFW